MKNENDIKYENVFNPTVVVVLSLVSEHFHAGWATSADE